MKPLLPRKEIPKEWSNGLTIHTKSENHKSTNPDHLPSRIFALILLLILPFIGQAAVINNVTIAQLNYKLNDTTLEAEVSGMGTGVTEIQDLVIPDKIEYNGVEFKVTRIGDRAFWSESKLSGTLTLGSSIKYIGTYAFNKCRNLTGSLIIPSSVVTIGDSAFESCIGFSGSLEIPNSVGTIGDSAFRGCSGFTDDLTIGNSVKTIGDHAFYGCTGFTGSLTIGESVETISDWAFYGCSGFTGSLTIGDSVETIGEYAFCDCTGFTGSLTIGEWVETIGINAFKGCIGFTGDLTIGHYVKTIGNNAFYNCIGFTGSLNIPNSVKTIGNNAFYNCRGFTGSLDIPNYVKTIGEYAFNGCVGFSGSLSIPNSVTEIGEGAFKGCTGFTGTLTLSSSLTAIPSYAFQNCKGFTGNLIIPDNVSSIGQSAFSESGNYDTLILPESLREIEGGGFASNHFSIIECSSITPPETASGAFRTNSSSNPSNYNTTKVYVPAESLSEYRSATEWKEFKTLNPNGPDATGITLDKTSESINTMECFTLVATIEPVDARDTTVVWTSSDPYIAYVDENGRVFGMGPGTAIITATTVNDLSATCEVTVSQLADFVYLDLMEATLKVSETVELKATIYPDNTTDQTLTWTSSNEDVATVDEEGKVTALDLGETVITVTTSNGLEATCKITVVETPASSIELNLTEATLVVTETVDLEATFLPETTTDKTLTWTSSDESIATVNEEGKVTALALGETVITVTTSNGLEATCKIKVVETPASSIEINLSEASLKVDETVELVATILPETTTDKTLTWSSSDESIATVDANGKVTAVAIGEATITVKTSDGVEATCKITVVETPASSIEINLSDATLKVGETVELTATILPETTTDQTLVWNSSDESIATVDENGRVTAIEVGEAIITVKTTNGLEATCKVTVEESLASSVVLKLADHKRVNTWIQHDRNNKVRVEVDAVSDTSVEVFSLNGELMMREMIEAGNYVSLEIGTENMHPGIYIIRVASEVGTATKIVTIK